MIKIFHTWRIEKSVQSSANITISEIYHQPGTSWQRLGGHGDIGARYESEVSTIGIL